MSKTAREPNEQGKLLIPEDVFDQLEGVRQSGVTNMVDRKTIKEYVPQFVSDWMDENEEIYMEGFFIGLAPKKGVFYYHSNYDPQ